MDQGDLADLQHEMAIDEAERDGPKSRTRSALLAQVAAIDDRLARFDDLDDLSGTATDLANALLNNASDFLATAVAFDRAHGASWTDIGAVLGVSKQSAWERFGP